MKKFGLLVASAALVVAVSGSAQAAHNQPKHNNGHQGSNNNHHQNRGLSRQDVMQDFMRSFNRLNRNGDNGIGRREMRHAQNRGRGRHVSYNGGNSPDYRNGRRSGHQDNRYSRRHNQSNQLITVRTFRRFDGNRDGFLTRRELRQGVKRAFRRADNNRNGFLGPREVRNARWYHTNYEAYRTPNGHLGHNNNYKNRHR